MSKFLIKYVPLQLSPLLNLMSVKLQGIVLMLVLTMLTISAKSVNVIGAAQKPSAAAPVKDAIVLAVNDVVQRNIETGATHAYQLALGAQQFARIVVEQKGVDAVLKVKASDKLLDR